MPVANFFIQRILETLRDSTRYEEREVDRVRFVLESIFWEIEKLLYLAILFILFGFGWHYLACVIAIATIRPDAGGFHSSTPMGCFFWTLLGFGLAIYVLPRAVSLEEVTIILIGAFSLVVTFIASPLRSKQMERIAKKDKDQQIKIKVTAVTLVWFIVLFAYQDHVFAPAVLWIIFLQNVQLAIEHMKRRVEVKHIDTSQM